MVDTDIIDWMQEHASGIVQNVNETFTLSWIDHKGFEKKTTEKNLRECVRSASTYYKLAERVSS